MFCSPFISLNCLILFLMPVGLVLKQTNVQKEDSMSHFVLFIAIAECEVC